MSDIHSASAPSEIVGIDFDYYSMSMVQRQYESFEMNAVSLSKCDALDCGKKQEFLQFL